jgi:glycosyltransferase involved in cell wall biosynthesis
MGATPLRVAVVSSVHRWNDTRVYLKETHSLVSAGFEVLLVAVAAEHQPSELGAARVVPLPRRKRLLRWLNALAVMRAAVRYRAHVVHAHDPELFPLVIMLKLLGMRTVCDVHEDFAEQIRHKEWIAPALRRGLAGMVRVGLRALPWLSDAVILAEDSYVRNFPSTANITVVRNFPLLPSVHKTEYREGCFRLIYVGDVRVVRGIATCIHVTHRLAAEGVPVELRVVGSFASRDEESSMHALVHRLEVGDRVSWLGRRLPEEVPELLSQCDIGLALLHPIGNYRESYPTKMFEYMAVGLPAVVSDFPLWANVLGENDCGCVVNPLDVDAVVVALRAYWHDPGLRRRHGANGRRAVIDRYQWEAEERKLLAVYAGFASRSGTVSPVRRS